MGLSMPAVRSARRRAAGRRLAGMCVLLLVMGDAMAVWAEPAASDVPLFHAMPKRIPHGLALSFSGPSWDLSKGRRVKGVDASSEGIELGPGGSAVLTLEVSRGNRDFGRRRYLFLVEASSGSEDAEAAVSLTCDGERSSTRAVARGVEVLMEEVADSHPLYPGHLSSSLTIRLRAVSGTVRFQRPRLYHVPDYGVRLRFTVLHPAEGRTNGRLTVIRRHRDTGHKDRIRHYYHSAVTSIAGVDGVTAGEPSAWVDLRPYLFGRNRATVSLTLGANAEPFTGSVTRARIELAFCMDDETDVTDDASSLSGDGLAMLDDVSGELDLGIDEASGKEPGAMVFWKRDLDARGGVFSFLMPESDRAPSAFFDGLLSLDGDVVDRLTRVRGEFGHVSSNDCRILIGANVSRLTGLVDEMAIEKEMELLAALGVNAITAEEACSSAFYAVRKRLHGQSRFRNRVYWARPGDKLSVHSPYDGDKLCVALDDHYRGLARQKPVFGRPSDPANAYLFDLADEPGDRGLSAGDQLAFSAFLKTHGVTPEMVGADGWASVRTFGYVEEKAFVPPAPPTDLQDLSQAEDVLTLEERIEEVGNEEQAEVSAPRTIEGKRLHYYTRRFAARKTCDFFKTVTTAVGEHFPGVLTCVNFRAGVRRVLTPETADWFLMGREKAVTMMWNEDWLNTYGWRNNGIQLVSYYVELMRAAARKHDLPIGGFLMCYWGQAELKSYSALAHGSRYLNYWRYGPWYANYLPYSWSHNWTAMSQIATVCRDVARLDGTLPDAHREPARVALLYAKTDPLWGRSQVENRLVFMALLHDQVPVDIITEAEIEEDGLLDGYDCLYVTDVSIRAQTLRRVADWVREGGGVWLSGGAGTRDEFDESCQVLTDALAVKSEAAGGGEAALRQVEGCPEAVVVDSYRLSGHATSHARVLFEDGRVAQLAGPAGKGRFTVCAFRPGTLYEATVRPFHNRNRGKNAIQKGWRPERREWITAFALGAEDVRPVALDRTCVEAVLYRHPDRDIVMLINYTGDYSDAPMRVEVRSETAVAKVESLRLGDLPFAQEAGIVSFSLPICRTDSVLLHHP